MADWKLETDQIRTMVPFQTSDQSPKSGAHAILDTNRHHSTRWICHLLQTFMSGYAGICQPSESEGL